jgi:hypothetical protein
MDELIKTLFAEWRVVWDQAPRVAIAYAIIAAVALWFVVSFIYDQRLKNKDSLIELLREGNANLQRQIDEPVKAPAPDTGEKYKGSTTLSLLFDGKGTIPTPVDQKNIFRWYALKNIVRFVNKETGAEHSIAIWNVFLVFEHPVPLKFVRVSFSGDLPQYEVKDSGGRHIVLAVMGDIPAGVLKLEAVSD